jgi:aminoglycoside 6'-N-acetyltransferase
MNSTESKKPGEDDLNLLYIWFKEPTINQMYASNKFWSPKDIQETYLPKILGKENIPSFIIYKNNNPIGFILQNRYLMA